MAITNETTAADRHPLLHRLASYDEGPEAGAYSPYPVGDNFGGLSIPMTAVVESGARNFHIPSMISDFSEQRYFTSAKMESVWAHAYHQATANNTIIIRNGFWFIGGFIEFGTGGCAVGDVIQLIMNGETKTYTLTADDISTGYKALSIERLHYFGGDSARSLDLYATGPDAATIDYCDWYAKVVSATETLAAPWTEAPPIFELSGHPSIDNATKVVSVPIGAVTDGITQVQVVLRSYKLNGPTGATATISNVQTLENTTYTLAASGAATGWYKLFFYLPASNNTVRPVCGGPIYVP